MSSILTSVFAWIGVFIALLAFVGFVFDFRQSVSVQKLYGQRSWVWHARIGVLTAWIWAPLILIGLLGFSSQIYLSSLASLIVLAIIFEIGYRRIQKLKISELPPLRFAAGAVGKSADQLDFTAPAEGVASRLLSLRDYVSVIGIYGPPGAGKSSFIRMVIESMPREDILYTYISLTETNEAKDFSALFAERWLKSLKERYPKIDTSFALPFMKSILRETGGVVAALFEFVPFLGKGLASTKVKEFDRALPPPSQSSIVSEEIANAFGNVMEIREKLWIVIVDEIERARFDEVYRVTEIIERYKNEGRTGVPVRVMFVLCVSDAEFRQVLQNSKDEPLARLINGFFFSGSKSLTMAPVYLPPVPYDKRVQYFRERLLAFNESLDQNQHKGRLEEDLRDIYFDTISRVDSFEPDEKKRFSRLVLRNFEQQIDDPKSMGRGHQSFLRSWYQNFYNEVEIRPCPTITLKKTDERPVPSCVCLEGCHARPHLRQIVTVVVVGIVISCRGHGCG